MNKCLFLVQTTGLPEFLDPEATRPLAVNPSHGSERAMNSENGPNLAPKLNPRKQEQGHTFDVAALAPRLGPQQRYVRQKMVKFESPL